MIFRSRKRRARTSDESANDESVDARLRDDQDAETPHRPTHDDHRAGRDQTADDEGSGAGDLDQADRIETVAGDAAPPAGGGGDELAAADEEDAAADEEAGGLSDAEMAELDAQDWRESGPYDIREVDAQALEEAADEEAAEQEYVDLGSMVLPATDDFELRLQVDEDSQQVVSVIMLAGDSALEASAFAAPSSGALWSEIRPEIISNVTENGGSANLVSGPFGVELRRLLPVETPDGEQGYQPSRMWLAEGPRWMLRGIVYGEAALAEGTESPAAELLQTFRQIVVRRGDEPMAPGDLLPLNLPESLVDSDETPAADDTADPGAEDEEQTRLPRR